MIRCGIFGPHRTSCHVKTRPEKSREFLFLFLDFSQSFVMLSGSQDLGARGVEIDLQYANAKERRSERRSIFMVMIHGGNKKETMERIGYNQYE